MKNYSLIIIIALGLFFTSCKSTFYIVRHGEKVDNSANPELSEAGKVRAEDLARLLADKKIAHIYSTNYLRTKNTGMPLALANKLHIELYKSSPADSMRVFIENLKKIHGKNVLIVGHSNTCKLVVNGLHERQTLTSDIPDNEFDNLYIVERSSFPIKKIKFSSRKYGQSTR